MGAHAAMRVVSLPAYFGCCAAACRLHAQHMSLFLVFARPQADSLQLGPYKEVIFMRADLITDGEALATHIEHRWHLRSVNERFSSVEVGTRVGISFEKDGKRTNAFGPNSPLRLMDGIAYTSGHVFAFFDLAQQDWYSIALGSHWPKMIVVPAPPLTQEDSADETSDD
jgi:hypothetical protein